jgi:ABC-type sugar transport system ATPase subunit
MDGVCKTFGRKTALDRADLELMEGEVLGLVGDNGAGKSTMLKILAGVLAMDAGRIMVAGETARIDSPRRARALGIEMVYQDLALCASMTVWENVFLGRYLTRPLPLTRLPILDKRRMADEASLALRELGIALASVQEPVRNLSGGEQQAVAMSRCLISRPSVVLLDEPTASMAVWEKDKVLRMILGLKEKGCAVIMVTHNLPELFRVADRALVLKEGRSIWCGPLAGMGPEDLAQMMFAGRNRGGS